MVADKPKTISSDQHILITPKFGGMGRSPAVMHMAKGIDVESLYTDETPDEVSANAMADLQKELGNLTGWKIEEFQPFFTDGAPPTISNSQKPKGT